MLKVFKELNINKIDIAYLIADSYTKLQNELVHLFPKSIETLEKIKSIGIITALVTNGSRESQRSKIDRFGLLKYFDYCFVEEEVGFGKPDIRIYKYALKTLNLDAADTWMVGDNLVWDVEAPQKLGIYAIWNDYRKRGLPEGSGIKPDRIINSIDELI
jgi:putative hydrolase of the HAD superfamily